MKRLVYLSSDQDSIYLQIFQSLQYEIVSPHELNGKEISYIVADKHIGSYEDLVSEFGHHPICSIGPVRDLRDFLFCGGKAIINSNTLKSKISLKLYELSLSKTYGQLELGSILGDDLNKVDHVKLSGHMSQGYYMDLIGHEIFEKEFNVISFRLFYSSLISYITLLKSAGVAGLPFEIEYGFTQDEMVFQCSVNVSHYILEYLIEGFMETNNTRPIRGLLNICYQSADTFSINYIDNKSMLVFFGVWMNEGQRNPLGYNSLFLSNLQTRKQIDQINTKILLSPRVYLDQKKDEIIKELEQKEFPSSYYEIISNEKNLMAARPAFLIKIIRFIQEERKNESNPKEPSSLCSDDIDYYLIRFPDQKLIKSFTLDDKNFILRFLTHPKDLDRIIDILEEIEKGVAEGKFHSEIVDKLINNLGSIELDEILKMGENPDAELENLIVKGADQGILKDLVEIVRGSSLSEDEIIKISGYGLQDDRFDTCLVKGIKEQGVQELYRISGHKEDDAQSFLKVIKSNIVDINSRDEDLRVKRVAKVVDESSPSFEVKKNWFQLKEHFLEKTMEKIHIMAKEGVDLETFVKELSQIVEDVFKVKNQDKRIKFLEDIFKMSVDDLYNEKIVEALGLKTGINASESLNTTLVREIEIKNERISQMSKVMDAMKIELGALRNLKNAMSEDKSIEHELAKVLRDKEILEKLIRNLKEGHQKLIELKTKEKGLYENRIRDLLQKILSLKSQTVDPAEYQKLQDENKNLSKLLETKDFDALLKGNRKEKYSKDEDNKKDELPKESLVDTKIFKRVEELDKQLVETEKERRQLEIKVKNLSMKLKHQSTTMEKQKDVLERTAGNVGNTMKKEFEKKHELLGKQFAKEKELHEKTKTALTESKKETLQFKNQINTMQNRIKELERKLGASKS